MTALIYDVEDTIVAVASAPGGAARGIVRLSGPRVVSLLQPYFVPTHGDLTEIHRATCVPGNWLLPPCRDELPANLMLWPTDHSYTRQPTGELHTIGSPPLLERMLLQLCESGARLARPGEFTLRAFLAGRLDLPQAEAVLGVIDAHDQRQLNVALSQLAGGLSHQLDPLRERLLNLCADIEAGLDFVDEGIEFIEPADVERILVSVDAGLTDLLSRVGKRSRSDSQPRVLLRGRPNVGKSTLWNALLRRDAAIVSDIPGTTRDVLDASLILDEQPIRLIDSAGIDASLNSGIDQASQQLAQQASEHSDTIILCLDATRQLDVWESDELWDAAGPEIVVLNKTDQGTSTLLDSLPSHVHVEDGERVVTLQWALADKPNAPIRSRELVKVSALTGVGLAELQHKLSNCLQQRSAEEIGLVAATATRCRDSLQQTLEAIRRARSILNDRLGQELLAAEVREALDHLGQILGTVYTDDILDRVFSRFCIGK